MIREYPRLSTTVIDAYVGPRICRLSHQPRKTAQCARRRHAAEISDAVERRLDAYFARRASPEPDIALGTGSRRHRRRRPRARTKRGHVVTFDMGGTSTDISVIVDGAILEMAQGQIAGQDIGTPMLRVRTLGAGGGTVAEIGKDGLLKVGPRSAGSAPGPACYGRGGTEATVTDANLLLGALSGETLLAGTLRSTRRRRARRSSAPAPRSAWTRCRQPPGSSASSIPTWPSTCGWRCRSRGRIRAPSRSSPSAALDRCTPRRWRAASAFRPCWCRYIRALIAHSACCRRACAIPIFDRRSGRSDAIQVSRVNELFAALEAQAMREAEEEGFSPGPGEDHAPPRSALPTPGLFAVRDLCRTIRRVSPEDGQERLRFAAQNVYGQNAPNEDAQIVTFRLQSEIDDSAP